MAVEAFKALGLNTWLAKQCAHLGYKQPTDVQKACVAPTLEGRDIYAAAKTGSGKTGAFALPILQMLSEDPFGVFAVVLTPTRELAFQVGEQFTAFGKPMSIRVAVVVGGEDTTKQSVELSRRPHIIVATPGRLVHHIEGGTGLDLSMARILVLDEADRLMTNLTLKGDMDVIYNALPEDRQNLLFSATLLTEPQGTIAQQLDEDPFKYSDNKDEMTVTQLRQQYIFMPSHMRLPYMVQCLSQLEEGATCVIFTPTCKLCEELAITLRELDYKVVALHSQMSQRARLDALDKFKSGFIQIMLATDVASRGLDIPHVQCVLNFNVPRVVEDYVHRVGRTARAGRGGLAVTMVGESDVELIQAIEEHIGKKLTEYKGIEEEEVVQSMNKINLARRAAQLNLIETGFEERLEAKKERALAKRQADMEAEAQEGSENDDGSDGSDSQKDKHDKPDNLKARTRSQPKTKSAKKSK
eukprot:TRINITY_DN12096_c0_g4_i1.p1 TRINITY_DN12096_c0_g4~~TRINITY_DN12096_c0_g4_i1.p1  ORF type:complete len:470 (+),score=141.31 TRINITY_DN12096_c0_g4_i1:52-1461(+)